MFLYFCIIFSTNNCAVSNQTKYLSSRMREMHLFLTNRAEPITEVDALIVLSKYLIDTLVSNGSTSSYYNNKGKIACTPEKITVENLRSFNYLGITDSLSCLIEALSNTDKINYEKLYREISELINYVMVNCIITFDIRFKHNIGVRDDNVDELIIDIQNYQTIYSEILKHKNLLSIPNDQSYSKILSCMDLLYKNTYFFTLVLQHKYLVEMGCVNGMEKNIFLHCMNIIRIFYEYMHHLMSQLSLSSTNLEITYYKVNLGDRLHAIKNFYLPEYHVGIVTIDVNFISKLYADYVMSYLIFKSFVVKNLEQSLPNVMQSNDYASSTASVLLVKSDLIDGKPDLRSKAFKKNDCPFLVKRLNAMNYNVNNIENSWEKVSNLIGFDYAICKIIFLLSDTTQSSEIPMVCTSVLIDQMKNLQGTTQERYFIQNLVYLFIKQNAINKV